MVKYAGLSVETNFYCSLANRRWNLVILIGIHIIRNFVLGRKVSSNRFCNGLELRPFHMERENSARWRFWIKTSDPYGAIHTRCNHSRREKRAFFSSCVLIFFMSLHDEMGRPIRFQLRSLLHRSVRMVALKIKYIKKFILKNKYDLTLCQSRLHTASETQRLRIRSKHFDRKEWQIWKKNNEKMHTKISDMRICHVDQQKSARLEIYRSISLHYWVWQ